MDELLTAAELAAGQLDWSFDNAQLYAEYRRLAAEQAALRRLAALVARGVEPTEVFDAVINEMRRCLNVFTAGLWRYESSGEITIVGAAPSHGPGEVARGHPNPDRRQHPGSDGAMHRPAREDGQLREHCGFGRRTGACCGRVRGGGRAGHRRWTGVGPGRRRVRRARAYAGRHRGPHQRLRRTDRRCRWWPDTATSRSGKCSMTHRGARL